MKEFIQNRKRQQNYQPEGDVNTEQYVGSDIHGLTQPFSK
jgi:hypothetical protein